MTQLSIKWRFNRNRVVKSIAGLPFLLAVSNGRTFGRRRVEPLALEYIDKIPCPL
jgi:hypothetical protein